MLDKDIANKIATEYGTPCYVFDQQEFVENYNHLLSSMRLNYENYNIAYSYKTNYTPYVCKCVKDLGGMAEVVSDMEYSLAKKLGYNNKSIIYNGPFKGAMLEEHILNQGIVNIDCMDEARRIVLIADAHKNTEFHVGIRLNLDIGAGFISRFGIENGSQSMDDVMKLLLNSSNIKVVGLHIHISRARDLPYWQKRIDQVLTAADKYLQCIPDYIDVGSGMYGAMEPSLEVQFGSNVPTYEDYSSIVAGTMAEHYKHSSKKPLLISEPGTTVVSKYWYLLTQVVQDKEISGIQFSTVDSSYQNAGETCIMKKLPYYVLRDGRVLDEKSHHKIDILGYTCLEQDRLCEDCEFAIHRGDVFVFGNVGGYSIVTKPPFIHPNCKALCIDLDQKIRTIKKTEKFEDVFNTFVF